MKLYKKSIILIFLLSLSSCSYYDELYDQLFDVTKKEVVPKVTSSKSVNIEKLWSTSIGDGRLSNSTILQPYFDGFKTIYSVDYKGLVTAIDIQSGDKLWSTRTNYNNNITSGISYHDNIVYFGTLDAKLYGYDIDYLKDNESYFESIDVTSILTKDILQPTKVLQLDSEIVSPAIHSDDQIFLRTSNGYVYAYNLNSQILNWQYIGRNIPLSIKGSGRPVLDFNNIYVAKDDGTIISLNQSTGKLNWLAYISPRSGRNELESLRDVEMTPLLLDDMIYVGSFQGSVVAVNTNTGNTMWTLPLSSLSNIINDNNELFITTSDGDLYSIDIYNGNTIWKTSLSQKKKLSHPISYDNLIIVFNENGFAYFVDKNDGSIINYKKMTDQIDHQIDIIKKDNTIYVPSKNGRISAFVIN